MIPARRIRTLHLAAPEERWIGRGACLVEDALRTASLPWADSGRLLLVRAVDLGTIPAGAAPASVALVLERRLRELTPVAVHASHPDAPRAAAVWFRDAAEAHALLAAKLARSEEPAAWFWPLAVSSWRPGTPPGTALRALLLGALETPAGPAAALELVRALREAGGLDLLAAALIPADGPWLLRACGWRVPRAGGGALPVIRGREALALARRAEEWGSGDARTAWLGAMLRAVENPARLGDPGLAEASRAGLVSRPAARLAGERGTPHPPPPSPIALPSPGRGGATAQEPSPPSSLPRGEEERTTRAPIHANGRGFPLSRPAGGRWERGPGGEGSPAPTNTPSTHLQPLPHPEREQEALERRPESDGWERKAPKHAGLADDSRVEEHSHPEPPHEEPLPPEPHSLPEDLSLPAGESTRFAGLFFLLPVLARLGLAGFLEENPYLLESGFPARLLDHIAARLGAAPDDPIRRALPLPEDGERQGEEIALKLWLTSLRRWCRRRACIGLADLIRRPGRVIATRTHIDVYFDPRFVEIRVRRAGLDLDPGWIPWLGRVVLFHYGPPPELVDAE